MKNYFLISFSLLLLSVSNYALGQKATFLIHHDSVYQQGFFNNEYLLNTKEIQFKQSKHSPYVTFKAEDVNLCKISGEYTLKGLPVEIDGKLTYRLLEVVTEGEIDLLVLRENPKRYFLEVNGELEELTNKGKKGGYKNRLNELLNYCKQQQTALRYVKYKRAPLKRIITDFNSKICNPYQAMSFGLLAGYQSTNYNFYRFEAPFLTDNDSKVNNSSFYYGGFIDLPVHKIYFFSFLSTFSYHRNNFKASEVEDAFDRDYNFGYSNLQFSILPKFNIKVGSRVNWHIEAGPSCIYFLDSYSNIRLAKKEKREVNFSEGSDFIYLPEYQMGISGSTGFQYFYSSRNYASLDLRSDYFKNGSKSSITNLSILLRLNIL